MSAVMRRNITVREEKGIGPVSFKRLLLAGGVAAAAAALGGRLAGFVPGCTGGLIVLALALALTQPVDGMPLAQYLGRTLRGLALLAALRGGAGVWGCLARLLRVAPQEGLLDAEAVYKAARDERDAEWLDEEWALLGSFAEAGEEGLSAIPSPFEQDGFALPGAGS